MATRQVSKDLFDKGLKAIADKFGPGYVKKGLSEPVLKAFPTGHDDLDAILTKGALGFYQGGIIELCGSEGTGKSSLALRTVGIAQKNGHRCCWIDTEGSFDENLASLNGVDPTQLLIPDLAETKAISDDGISLLSAGQVLEMVNKTVASNMFGIVVLDSVAGLIPPKVLEEKFDPNTALFADLARVMSVELPKIVQSCKKTETTVIFINQLRDQPGAYYANPYHTPGGRALKFFAHQRLAVSKINGDDGKVESEIDGKPTIIGHYARVKIIKNKKAPPVFDVTLEVPVYYRPYFPDNAKKLYDLARKLQVITIRNGVLTWKDEDNNIIVQKNGEAQLLVDVRTNKLEPRLAKACISAAEEEKNNSKKSPIQLSAWITDLAKTYDSKADSDSKTRTKKSA